MTDQARHSTRRRLLGAGLAAGAAISSPASAAHRAAVPFDSDAQIRPFAKTDERDLRADDPDLPPRARALIRIGERGIAREDPAAMTAFFHPDFRFHGPGGAELDREGLWGYFAACRSAFDDFSVTRQTLLSDGGDHIAARTRFSGIFMRPFAGRPGDPLPPNGKAVEYRLLNIFRYSNDGRLVEEWAQYDVQAFLDQLR